MSKNTSTEYLSSRITEAKSLEEFEKHHSDSLQSAPFHLMLQQLIAQANMSVSDAIKKANVAKSYGYQLMSGDREPSRDKVLAFSLGLGVELQVANRLLRAAKKSPLYVKDARDMAIIFALTNGFSLIDTNILLQEKGHTPIE